MGKGPSIYLASLLPSLTVVADGDDDDLEAELLALEGKSSGKGGKKGKEGRMTLEQLDTMVAGLEGVGESGGEDEEEEGDLSGDEELLGELAVSECVEGVWVSVWRVGV